MRKRWEATATLERAAVRMEPRAVMLNASRGALAERPALVQATVHGVVRSQLSAGLMDAPALTLTQVQAAVSGASRRASVSAQRARASGVARDTRPQGRDRVAGSTG